MSARAEEAKRDLDRLSDEVPTILVVGNTGSGKSNLINFLLGEVVAVVSGGLQSETSRPQVYRLEVGDRRWVNLMDTQGLMDTGGPKKDEEFVYSLSTVIRTQSIKGVIFVQSDRMTPTSASLANFVTQVMLGFELPPQRLLCIVTKNNEWNQPQKVAQIRADLRALAASGSEVPANMYQPECAHVAVDLNPAHQHIPEIAENHQKMVDAVRIHIARIASYTSLSVNPDLVEAGVGKLTDVTGAKQRADELLREVQEQQQNIQEMERQNQISKAEAEEAQAKLAQEQARVEGMVKQHREELQRIRRATEEALERASKRGGFFGKMFGGIGRFVDRVIGA